MKISEQDVLHVADLANLELREVERARLVRELNSILEYVDRLNELDTDGVAPMAQVVPAPEAGERTNTMRADEPRPSLSQEAVLKNAPDSDGAFFRVPKVIER